MHPMNPNGTTGGGTRDADHGDHLGRLQQHRRRHSRARHLRHRRAHRRTFSVGSNKTIVGLCGAEIHGHVDDQRLVNVIVRNIKIVGYGVGNCALDPSYDPTVGCSSGDDAITVAAARTTSGSITATSPTAPTATSTSRSAPTSSPCRGPSSTTRARTDNTGNDSTGAAGHRFSNLIGGGDNSPGDVGKLNVTWHHDWWADNVSRAPAAHPLRQEPPVQQPLDVVGRQLLRARRHERAHPGREQRLRRRDQPAAVQQHRRPDDVLHHRHQQPLHRRQRPRSTGGGGTPFTTPPYTYTLTIRPGLQAAITAGAGPH